MVRVQQRYQRLPWADRFNRPTDRMLRSPLPDPHASLLEQVRRLLTEISGVEERIVWRGPCWRWTFEYRANDLARGVAVVIPNPDDLQLAVPVDPQFVRLVSSRRMSRPMREGLELAAAPFHTEWGLWSITSVTLLKEVVALTRDHVAFVRTSGSS